MKFGHNLPRNQVPEWASHYINYKGLKRLVKSAAETSKNEGEADLAGEHAACHARMPYWPLTAVFASAPLTS